MKIQGLMAAAAAACSLLAVSTVHGQTKFEWKQTSSLARGLNMPAGVKAEAAGIETGMTFAEAKAILEKLAAEAAGEKSKIEEQIMRARLPAIGTDIQVQYVGSLSLKRTLAGSGQKPPKDFIEVTFSAPSSGHQVTSVDRTLTYDDPADQPKISETLAALERRLGMKGDVLRSHGMAKYTFGFSNGKPEPVGGRGVYCSRDDQCLVQIVVEFTQGIAEDRASRIGIGVLDKARTELNQKADQQFLQEYLNSLAKGTVAPPKL